MKKSGRKRSEGDRVRSHPDQIRTRRLDADDTDRTLPDQIRMRKLDDDDRDRMVR